MKATVNVVEDMCTSKLRCIVKKKKKEKKRKKKRGKNAFNRIGRAQSNIKIPLQKEKEGEERS